ncbi:hypothetical protein T4C_10806 [Trichinella pseudospiralis]|uniref:Uncharacterized protein n=1 Tax=Trichinella pseudospiralis TaxID=6337 RepID=A0A0V1GHR4_TRIPS|nr:hypothetical protein T4C_10806 [Trichinella pseudospiralis]
MQRLNYLKNYPLFENDDVYIFQLDIHDAVIQSWIVSECSFFKLYIRYASID